MSKPSFRQYTEPQTRSWQRKCIENAKKMGELHFLYWFIATDKGDALAVRSYDGRLIVPVIPVAPDEKITGHWAELMAGVARIYHPQRTMMVSLTSKEALDGLCEWYVWGDEDHVCPGCGAINNDCICSDEQKRIVLNMTKFEYVVRLHWRNNLEQQSV